MFLSHRCELPKIPKQESLCSQSALSWANSEWVTDYEVLGSPVMARVL